LINEIINNSFLNRKKWHLNPINLNKVYYCENFKISVLDNIANRSNGNLIFISYAHEDLEKANMIYNDLKNAGLTPWLDKEDLDPGENWELTIRKTIQSSRYFIAVLSQSLQRKGVVHSELKKSLEILELFPESDIYIIPVRINNCEIPYEKLKSIHYQDLFPEWNKGMRKIINVIKKNSKNMTIPINDKEIIIERSDRQITLRIDFEYFEYAYDKACEYFEKHLYSRLVETRYKQYIKAELGDSNTLMREGLWDCNPDLYRLNVYIDFKNNVLTINDAIGRFPLIRAPKLKKRIADNMEKVAFDIYNSIKKSDY
jgi:hypothetical protein